MSLESEMVVEGLEIEEGLINEGMSLKSEMVVESLMMKAG